MGCSNIDHHFRALWCRASNEPSLRSVTSEMIGEWAVARGLVIDAVEQRDVGAFVPTPSIVLMASGARACFPLTPASGDAQWEARRAAHERRALLWAKLEWFEPPWLPHGRVDKMLAEVKNCSKQRAVELFEYHTSTLYTIPFQAVCIAQLMPNCPCLRDFCPLVREAFLAFFSGSRASSIAALIPVVEGALTRIIAQQADLPTPEKVNRVVDGAIARAAELYFDGMWAPPAYSSTAYLFALDNRVFMFETFRRWLLDSFFRRTGEYDGATWLNRHLFAHGASSSWQQVSNFRRLVVALTMLGLVEAWRDRTNAVPLVLFPEMDDDGHLLWQYALFQAEAQGILTQIAEKRYHENGRLVPELPTDNGALLRRALLTDDCIKDLVRPLRDHGWSVVIDEPESNGLYVIVRASASDANLRIALLYLCATANEVYRTLAGEVDVILYRGAPYHEEEYAFGIDLHVGPVTGWQPPRVPG